MPAHIPETGKQLADLWCGNSDEYRDNAYKKISYNKYRRKRYDDVKLLQRTLANHPDYNVDDKGTKAHAKRQFFKFERNFDSGYAPWTNQAHHLLPQEFWKGLTPAQMGLLQQIEYSINNGHNLIYLPTELKGQLMHELPIHNGSHDSYNSEVIKDASKVKKKLKKAEKEGEFCERANPPEDILKRLKELQDKYWDILAKTKIKKVADIFQIQKSFSK